ncbi:hypothetical protein [Mesorhizobium sp. B2-6-5]|uniref:hypothetical protein n=1 Tax=Mesorhizobium sp. B2-6-5 TaxID=2589912 RepID=UPI0015E2EE1D|nr:hypothetical protein [Mesorhizobium sp. B2-6-5]
MGTGDIAARFGSAEVSIEFKRNSRINRVSRNEIAKFPVREFAKGAAFSSLANLGRNNRAADVVDQMTDNRLANPDKVGICANPGIASLTSGSDEPI